MTHYRNLFGILLATTFLSVTACDNSDSGDDSGGSCTMTDENGKYCFEVQEDTYSIKSECGFFGGKWTSSPCDTTLYTKQCVQETDVSEDNEKTWQTVHYVYYLEESATTMCAGDETNL